MNPASFRKTTVAVAVAGTLAAAGIPKAEAVVINLSWSGAFTILLPTGVPYPNSPSDYKGLSTTAYPNGYYANGAAGFGTPYFPGNAANGIPNTYYAGAVNTIHGWKGNRTPVSGTMSFDTVTGAGVGMINPFFLAGDTPGTGVGTSVAHMPNFSFQPIDTNGTLVGTMLMSWNGDGHSVSVVLDASGMFGAILQGAFAGGATSTISGVGSLPASNDVNFGTAIHPLYVPIGPAPIATKTLNALGCEAQPMATQVNAWTIVASGNIANCDLTQDDGIGGSPIVSAGIGGNNFNFDFTSIHYDSYAIPETVPLPPAVWLFGSGLLGLIGLRKRKKDIP